MEEPELPVIDVARVRAQLEERERDDRMDDGEPTPVVVCERVSRADFREWLDNHEGKLRCWEYEPLSETHGRVVVWSLPNFTRENTKSEVSRLITTAVQRISGDIDVDETLSYPDATRIDVGDRDQAADASIMPEDAPYENDQSVVIEVSYRNEKWEDVIAKLERWLSPSTTVQVAIGVKIWPNKPRRTIIVLRRNPAFVGDEDAGVDRLLRQELDFETANDAPLPEVGFPLRLLYHGVATPLQLQDHEDVAITIDLARLLKVINGAVRRDARRREVAQLHEDAQLSDAAQRREDDRLPDAARCRSRSPLPPSRSVRPWTEA
ncbi:hypothetical protein PybrP1_009779 [[Pythium] brassicae (nom. inval.)]|nr:hypothetical protein PybrP1_009779 [[Pythium] brassicae (nom. inval.)]